MGRRGQESDLPQRVLIATAMAACQISQEVMDKAIRIAHELQENGLLQPMAELIIQSQTSMRAHLFEVTHNDPKKVNADTIGQALHSFAMVESSPDREREAAESKAKYNAQLQAQLSRHHEELAKKDAQVDRLKSEQEQQKTRIYQYVESKAKRWASNVRNAVNVFLWGIWGTSMVLTLVLWVKYDMTEYTFWKLAASILSLLQSLDYFLNVFKCKRRMLSLIYNKVYATVYDYHMKAQQKIFQMPM